MNPRGVHYLGEFIRCSFNIKDTSSTVKVVEDAIKKTGFTLIKTFTYEFNPMGATIVSIIGESHIALHTYPEVGHITIDVFTCTGNPEKLFWELKKVFKPEFFKYSVFMRGYNLSLQKENSITSPSPYGFDTRYSISKVIYSGQTKFQQVDIIKNNTFGLMLFLDEDLQLSQYDIDQYNKAISWGIENFPQDSSILILGGGDGALLNFLLEKGYSNVRLVDIDAEFIELADKYLHPFNKGVISSHNDKIIISEAKDFLINSSENYDIIISDLTIMPESFSCVERTLYLKDLISFIAKRLKNGGIFTFQAASTFDKETLNIFEENLPTHFSTCNFQEVFLPSFGEKWVFGRAFH